jgi:hypothetical protein
VLQHALLVLVVGAIGAAAAFVLTYWATEGPDRDRFDVAIKAATAIAALAAGLLTWARLELSRREHHLAARAEYNRSNEVAADQRLAQDRDLTERYSRSVDQIGSADLFTRVGGIYALERFALDAARRGDAHENDWVMALDVLAALARELSKEARRVIAADGEAQRPDDVREATALLTPVVEAVRVLGRFRRRARLGEAIGATMERDLSGVIARSAHLDLADLAYSTMTRADLSKSDLSRADLSNANLLFADLRWVDLTRARLDRARLTDADLDHTCLADASVANAELVSTSLCGADLTDAALPNSNLRGANLSDANLSNSDLSGADLSYANLTNANLNNATLNQATLSGVRHTDTTWPAGTNVHTWQKK